MKKRIPAAGMPAVVQKIASADAADLSPIRDMPAMVHSIDADGVIVDVSQKWLEVLGYSRSEAIGRRSIEFLTEESRAYATENVLPEFFRTGRCVDVPYQVLAKDGRVLDVLLSATCVRGDDGQVLRSIAIMQDVTARKRAERRLDAAKAYAENLLYTANVLVVELDTLGCVSRLNRAVEHLLGYTTAELSGQEWFRLVSPPDHYPRVHERLAHLGSTGSDRFESPVLSAAGVERQVVWRNSPVIDHDRVVGLLCVGVDVTEQRRAEARLAVSEQALRDAQSIAQIGSWMLDYQTGEVHWSEQMFRFVGLDPVQTEPSMERFLQAVHPDDRAEVEAGYRQALARHRPYDLRHRLLLDDGSVRYVHHCSRLVHSRNGRPERVVGIVQDVTLTVLQEQALQQSEELFRTVADYTCDWEYWQGRQKEMLYVSPSCLRVTGYSPIEFISDPGLFVRIVHPDDRVRFEAHLDDFECERDLQIEFRIITKDGEERWISHGCRPVYTKDGQRNGRRVNNRDITELKAAERQAHRLAYYDALTELPNRRLLMDRLGKAIPLANRQQRPLALMFIDLDRFKNVNDAFGHDVGDSLLIEVGRRFAGCLRTSDTIARAGGDEFIVLLPEIADAAHATAVAGKLLAALRPPVVCGDVSFDVSASIGIAVLAAGGSDDSSGLMKKADIAMYAAKQAGRNQFQVF
ncbi:MAG: PAS domain S-box protein [Rhodocyclales bacterium]|nr:PAS domain S-box protein [Rhodocyclales bacterium]